ITRYRIKQTPAAAQRLQITPYVVASYTHHGSGVICSHLLPQFVWSSIPNRQNCGVPHYRDTTTLPTMMIPRLFPMAVSFMIIRCIQVLPMLAHEYNTVGFPGVHCSSRVQQRSPEGPPK